MSGGEGGTTFESLL